MGGSHETDQKTGPLSGEEMTRQHSAERFPFAAVDRCCLPYQHMGGHGLHAYVVASADTDVAVEFFCVAQVLRHTARLLLASTKNYPQWGTRP
ncbi:hypothetical protein D4R47_00515 [archaeon]|nr:MAG: hypothetical protein D4R47_00515 [archaeon]